MHHYHPKMWKHPDCQHLVLCICNYLPESRLCLETSEILTFSRDGPRFGLWLVSFADVNNTWRFRPECKESGLLHNLVVFLSKQILDQCRFGSVYRSSCNMPNTVWLIWSNGCTAGARLRLLVAGNLQSPSRMPSILIKVGFSQREMLAANASRWQCHIRVNISYNTVKSTIRSLKRLQPRWQRLH